MSYRPIAGFLLLFAASCLGAPPPPASSAPSDKTPKAPAASDTSSSADGCGKVKIHSKSDFDACNKKCKDDQQDQQRQCSDPQCQQGIGQGARLCLGKCEEGQTSSRQAKCYKE